MLCQFVFITHRRLERIALVRVINTCVYDNFSTIIPFSPPLGSLDPVGITVEWNYFFIDSLNYFKGHLYRLLS
jgi:hypothetical protein